jgi:glyoxylase-like metal-dependent hydrolase (beta-lactamase superfamily II)
VTPTLSSEPAPGVHLIPVNCYLLRGSPLTLVDTGPGSALALDVIERALAELGVQVRDLELIALTHQHMDHEGLVEILVRRSGAELAAYAPLRQWLADYRASARADDAYAQAVMRQHGLPNDLAALLGVLAAGMHAYGSPGAVTIALDDGDRLSMGAREFSVHHRPGHSPSDIVFLHEPTGLMLGGDHLLAHISSNALVGRPLNAALEAPRPQPLVAYARSLAATRMMPVGLLLTGHGEPIGNHRTLIDARLKAQRRRASQILGLLAGGPLTAHAIAQQMWGEIAITQAYLTLSETLGHLDLLVRDGSARETGAAGLRMFEAA